MHRSAAQPARKQTQASEAGPQWASLVSRILRGDPSGVEDLYRVFSRGVRFYLCRQLGPEELDDRVHDTFLIVLEAIRAGELRQPERLIGFVRTIVRRQVASYIGRAVRLRREYLDLEYGARVADLRSDPERSVIEREQAELMVRILRGVGRRDREILTRFYLLGQTAEQICADMNLSETQFRLLKSRAKTRFGQLGRRRLEARPIAPVFVRASLTA